MANRLKKNVEQLGACFHFTITARLVSSNQLSFIPFNPLLIQDALIRASASADRGVIENLFEIIGTTDISTPANAFTLNHYLVAESLRSLGQMCAGNPDVSKRLHQCPFFLPTMRRIVDNHPPANVMKFAVYVLSVSAAESWQ